MEESLISAIGEKFDLNIDRDIRTISPVSLAYVGDGIYDLIVRTIMIEEHNAKAGALHRLTTRYVKADAQAKMMEILEPILTEEENAIYHRGRNCKSGKSAKNASHGAYRKATGFEAVMGYLYMMGQTDRLLELVKLAIDNYTPDEREGTEARNSSKK